MEDEQHPSKVYGNTTSAAPAPPASPASRKSWFRRHPVLVTLIGLVLLLGVRGALVNDGQVADKPATAAPSGANDPDGGVSPASGEDSMDPPTEEPESSETEGEPVAQPAHEPEQVAASEEAAETSHEFGIHPEQEEAFLEAVVGAQAGVEGTESDLQLGALKADRDQSICATLDNRTVVDWQGKVTELDANGDGLGIVTITLAEGVRVGTWNNFISDAGDNTLIDPASAVFANAMKLAEGDIVKFSGEFVSDSQHGCIRESSLTLEGGLKTPSFKLRFSGIDAATE